MDKLKEDGGTNLMATDPVPGQVSNRAPQEPIVAPSENLGTPGGRNLAAAIGVRVAAAKKSKLDKLLQQSVSPVVDNTPDMVLHSDNAKEIAINSHG